MYIKQKKIKVIKLGFDKNLYYPKNEIRKQFFLVIGRHNPYKNLARLLEAFKLFNNKLITKQIIQKTFQ